MRWIKSLLSFIGALCFVGIFAYAFMVKNNVLVAILSLIGLFIAVTVWAEVEG